MNIAAQIDLCPFRTRQYRSTSATSAHSVSRSSAHDAALSLSVADLPPEYRSGGGYDSAMRFRANRSMINSIQTGDVSQRACREVPNVGVRFLTADMLLASLHRHAQCGIARRIF